MSTGPNHRPDVSRSGEVMKSSSSVMGSPRCGVFRKRSTYSGMPPHYCKTRGVDTVSPMVLQTVAIQALGEQVRVVILGLE